MVGDSTTSASGSKRARLGSRFGSQRAKRASPVRRSASPRRSRARAWPESSRSTLSKATCASGKRPAAMSCSPCAARRSISARSSFCCRRPSRTCRARASREQASAPSALTGSEQASVSGPRAGSYCPASKRARPSARAFRRAARVVEAWMRSSATRRPSRPLAFRGSSCSASSKATFASVALPSSRSRSPSARRCSSRRARAAASRASACAVRCRSCSWVTERRVSGSSPRASTSAWARRGSDSLPGAPRPELLRLAQEALHLAPRPPGSMRVDLDAWASARRRMRSAWSGVFLMAPCCSERLKASIAAECSCSSLQTDAEVVVGQVVLELQPVGLDVGGGPGPQAQRLAQVAGRSPPTSCRGCRGRGPGGSSRTTRARPARGRPRRAPGRAGGGPATETSPTSRTSPRCERLARWR